MTDTRVRSQFLLLGETSPVLGVAEVFMEQEPLVVKSISIDINQASTPTVQDFLVYNEKQGVARTGSAGFCSRGTYALYAHSPVQFLYHSQEARPPGFTCRACVEG